MLRSEFAAKLESTRLGTLSCAATQIYCSSD